MTLTDDDTSPIDCLMVAHSILTMMIDDRTREGLPSWNEQVVRIQVRAALDRLGYPWDVSS